jgi:monoamine oxidase
MDKNDNHSEVLVIGAGFAGLAAALRLAEKGADVRVVEARERVGGRTFTRWLDSGLQIDLGGQWFGPTQTRVYELASELGIKTFPLQEIGESVHYFDGGAAGADIEAEVQRVFDLVDKLAASINLEDVAQTPKAEQLDKQTFHSWLLERTTKPAAAVVGRMLAGGLLAVDAGDVSALSVAYYVASGSGVKDLISTAGGAQQDRVVGGPPALAEAMLKKLGTERVMFDFPVAAVSRQDERWTVRAKDGRELSADKIICTIPPAVIDKVEFSPLLPTAKRRAYASMLPGNAMKYHAVYPAPTWRERGLSGVFVAGSGRITEAVDNSVPGTSEGVLTFFTYGDDTVDLSYLGAAERREILLTELADRLGDEALKTPTEFIEFSWTDESYTGGCFSASFAVGAMHHLAKALSEPWQEIYFAGTETSAIWNGYIEGAIRSGEREAERILAQN